MSLSFEKRKKKIMECLNKEGKVEVQALADELGVSTETIRRDLERLDQEGKLKKVYGGAVKVRADAFELPFDKKTLINAKEKAAIGRRAAALVKDGDTIMIGNGTSTLEVVRNLHSHPNVTIVTHSTPVLLLAMEMFPGRIIFVGGEVNRHQRSVSGPLSELVLNRLRVNKAFISAGGVSLVDGITDYEISEANISRIMIERADEAIHRPQVLVAHVAQIEPGHRRQPLDTRKPNPLLFRHRLHREAQIRGIAHAPGPLESHVPALQPVAVGHRPAALGVTRRMAVVAAADADQVAAALDGRIGGTDYGNLNGTGTLRGFRGADGAAGCERTRKERRDAPEQDGRDAGRRGEHDGPGGSGHYV